MKKSVFIVVDERKSKRNCAKKFTNKFLHFEKNLSCPIIKNYVLVDYPRKLV